MSDAGEVVFRVAGLALMVAGWLTGTWTWRSRDRWGRMAAPARMVGEGAYRRGVVRSWVPRGTPIRVVLVGAMGVAWGTLTGAVLAPAGLVFLLAPAHVEPGLQMMLTMSGLGVFGTALGGIALGCVLVRTSCALLERAPDVLDRALPTAMWSAIHHVLVLTSFVLFAIHEREPAIAFAVAVPCSIGLAHAWALAHGARYVARLSDLHGDEAPIGDRTPL
ncbi:MAG: hypothetical protein M3Y87_20515 [Myxococcota bacterium]|nr:hypothetical protein [Myxococcota bacterium]